MLLDAVVANDKKDREVVKRMAAEEQREGRARTGPQAPRHYFKGWGLKL